MTWYGPWYGRDNFLVSPVFSEGLRRNTQSPAISLGRYDHTVFSYFWAFFTDCLAWDILRVRSWPYSLRSISVLTLAGQSTLSMGSLGVSPIEQVERWFMGRFLHTGPVGEQHKRYVSIPDIPSFLDSLGQHSGKGPIKSLHQTVGLGMCSIT